MSYRITPIRLRNLSREVKVQKLDKANEILSDLDKAKVLGYPTPYELADKYMTHNLADMISHDYEYISKKLRK